MAQSSDGKKMLSPYHEHQVKNTIMKNRSDIIDCYNAFIETKPEVTDGPVKVDFEIDDDGKVTRSGFVQGIGTEIFRSCITKAITTWKFPDPNIPSPVYVDHTFTFKKQEETQK